jgi:hypothetical protein
MGNVLRDERHKGGISLAQEQGAEQDGQGLSLNALLASTLASLEQKRVDFPSLIAVLSLFNLFSVLNNPAQGQPKTGPAGIGGADLLGMLTSMLGGGGGSPGTDMLGGLGSLLQKQGKNINPQMLMSLLSLLGEARASAPQTGVVESAPAAPPERRPGRGLL